MKLINATVFAGLFMLLVCGQVRAQSANLKIIQKNIPPGEFQLSSIWNIDLVNPENQAMEIFLEASIEADQGVVYAAYTQAFRVQPGMESLGTNNFPGIAQVQINRLEEALGKSGVLRICIEARTLQKTNLANSCLDFLPIPTAPPRLVYPFDEEAVDTDIPTFSWLPPMPAPVGISYKLNIVELGKEENALSYFLSKPSFFIRERLPNLQMIYPLTAPAFDRTRQYAWQIEAFVGGQSLGKTEVWTFHFKDNQKNLAHAVDNHPGPFPELEPSLDGSYYLANDDKLPFYFDSRYNEQDLIQRLTLYQPGSAPIAIQASQLQKIDQQRYFINLANGPSLTSGEYYILEVLDAKNKRLKMRFKYY